MSHSENNTELIKELYVEIYDLEHKIVDKNTIYAKDFLEFTKFIRERLEKIRMNELGRLVNGNKSE